MKKKEFVKCGFEFTASAKHNKPLKSTRLKIVDDSVRIKSYGDKRFSDFDWINENYNSDDCGCEVSTPIVNNELEVLRYFVEFQIFVNKVGMTLDLDKAKCCLGGCHIHMAMPKLTKAKQELFLKNVAIFLTNYPQLNWGFNDPNDNWNANSLLDERTDIFWKKNLFESGMTNLYYDIFSSKRYDHFMHPYIDDKSPLRAFLAEPLRFSLKKFFALRYNEDYKTVEFRIFDMPKNLMQHELHYTVASRIYERCLEKTMEGKTFTLRYNNKSQIVMPLEQAVSEFYEAMKFLGIEKGEVKEQVDNIGFRYQWNKEDKKENYLA